MCALDHVTTDVHRRSSLTCSTDEGQPADPAHRHHHLHQRLTSKSRVAPPCFLLSVTKMNFLFSLRSEVRASRGSCCHRPPQAPGRVNVSPLNQTHEHIAAVHTAPPSAASMSLSPPVYPHSFHRRLFALRVRSSVTTGAYRCFCFRH